ncbi:MAG: hypothetical protein DRN91_09055 [Candidatus Alkanophagales archaeon]|nr:MAG: hypothetical protein DRN91_09055 [Candidatus Alkanophagales archaeon]
MKECIRTLRKVEEELSREIEPEVKQIAAKFERTIQKLELDNENDKLYIIEFLLNRLIDFTRLSTFLEIWLRKDRKS